MWCVGPWTVLWLLRIFAFRLNQQTLDLTCFLGKLFLMGDFNASVGADRSGWGDFIGKHSVCTANSNGLRLLNTCSEFEHHQQLISTEKSVQDNMDASPITTLASARLRYCSIFRPS